VVRREEEEGGGEPNSTSPSGSRPFTCRSDYNDRTFFQKRQNKYR
jgi:hypothetical protein